VEEAFVGTEKMRSFRWLATVLFFLAAAQEPTTLTCQTLSSEVECVNHATDGCAWLAEETTTSSTSGTCRCVTVGGLAADCIIASSSSATASKPPPSNLTIGLAIGAVLLILSFGLCIGALAWHYGLFEPRGASPKAQAAQAKPEVEQAPRAVQQQRRNRRKKKANDFVVPMHPRAALYQQDQRRMGEKPLPLPVAVPVPATKTAAYDQVPPEVDPSSRHYVEHSADFKLAEHRHYEALSQGV